MLRKSEARKKHGLVGDTGDGGRLLEEIEALTDALYLKKPSENRQRTISVGKSQFTEPRSKTKAPVNDAEFQIPPLKDKRTSSSSSASSSSIWNWKPLRALSHIRHRRFDCRFILQVHSVQGLSPGFNGATLCVRWKRNIAELGLCTRHGIVSNGVAKFEETLEHKCAVYGSRGGGPHPTAKYEARQFILYASVVGKPEIDLGKHRVDLTRLLPLTLEELEEGSSGKWSTSFKLSGKGKNASLNVSFGFSVLGNGDLQDSGGRRKIETDKQISLRKSGGIPFRNLPSRSAEVSSISRLVGVHKNEEIDENPAENLAVDTRRELDDIISLHELPIRESGKRNEEGDDHELEISAKKEVEVLLLAREERRTVSHRDVEDWRVDDEDDDDDDDDEEEVDAQTNDDDIIKREEHGTVSYGDVKDWMDEDDDDEEKVGVLTNDDDIVEKEEHRSLSNGDVKYVIDDDDKEKVDALTNDDETVEREHMTASNRDVKDWRDDDDDDKGKIDARTNDDDIVDREEHRTVSNGDAKDWREDEDEDDHDHDQEEFDALLTQIHESDGEIPVFDLDHQEESISDTELLLQELESALENLPIFESEEFEDQSFEEESYEESSYMDDVTETVASEFLSMLETEDCPIGSNPESPRERLWQEFKNESLLDLESIFDQELEDLDLSSLVEDAEAEVLEMKSRGRMLEHEEAEALMHELGFNEESFVNSPVDFSTKDVGPLLRTKDGGFLRSMRPSLMMQVSSPVVVPAEMGSSAMEILESLASVGIEKLSVQASKLMPLEDITGKTIQEVSCEAVPSPGVNERQSKQRATSVNHDYVSLEELAPLAMEKIESLAIEGLRIQSGMSERDARVDLECDGAVGLHLQKVNACTDEVDGLMGLSISLQEWIKLDSGLIDEAQITEKTSKILSAHRAKRDKSSWRKRGILGNNLTVALMVQLRDPLGNFKPVGSPMLSLIQVERVFVPPKPRLYCTVSDEGNSEEVDEVKREKVEVNAAVTQFKITGVHVAGLKNDPSERKLWGNSSQRQAGSRWLVANGMGKVNKHPLTKSTPGETLWSVSSWVNARGSRWSELPTHKRNPNILVPK